MERRTLKRVVAAVLLLGVVAGGAWGAMRYAQGTGRPILPGQPQLEAPRPIVPAGVRVRVEVVNSTTVRGLARKATLYLRDLGFDVVAIRTSRELRDTTLVVDRAGNAEWARLLSGALGKALIETRPDTLRYVDATVFLGATWRPPAQPFYP